MKITTHDARETKRVAGALGRQLKRGDLVVLTGDLGSGKTTFAQGVAEALGVTEPVTSPTFTIVQEYEGALPIAHVDVYRMQRMQELHDLGFEELIENRVVLIEWGEAVLPALPADRIEVRLRVGDDPAVRDIEIEGRGARALDPVGGQ